MSDDVYGPQLTEIGMAGEITRLRDRVEELERENKRLLADRNQFDKESCERFNQLDVALARIEELERENGR